MNKYLRSYLVAVEHPHVSGFEHLDTLLVRDKLAEQEAWLTPEQRAQLSIADRQLLDSAAEFYDELALILDLAAERQRRRPSPEHWWWFLDVIASLPSPPIESSGPEFAR